MGALNRKKRGPCSTAPQQPGLREGIHDPAQPPEVHPFCGRIPLLLQGQESREEALGKLQRCVGESPSNPLPAILQGLQREVFQSVLHCPWAHPTRRVSPLLDGATKVQETKGSWGADSPDRELCQLLSSLGVVFNTTQLIKHEFNAKDLKGYIGISFCLYLVFTCTLVSCCCSRIV